MCLLLNLISFISDIERCEMAIFGSLRALQVKLYPRMYNLLIRGLGGHGSINMSASYPEPPAGELFSAGWQGQVRKLSNFPVFVPQHLDTQLDIGTVTWDREDDMS